MARNRISPSRRREDIRAWWAEHLATHRKSAQTQAAYCRAQGLDPKYFTLWKGKLRDAEMAGAPRMVPVVVALAAEPAVPAIPKVVGPSAVASLRLSLGNGMSLSLEIAPAAALFNNLEYDHASGKTRITRRAPIEEQPATMEADEPPVVDLVRDESPLQRLGF